jgi:hypothetical protein
MKTQNEVNLTGADVLAERIAMEVYTEWQREPEKRPDTEAVRWIDAGFRIANSGPLFFLSTDQDSGNDAQERGAAFGFDNIQILFPRDGLPSKGRGLIVALDELLLDARERQQYLAWLESQVLPLPTAVLSYDFHLEPPTVVRPGLLLAVRLEDVFRALRDGHVSLPVAEPKSKERKAA